MVTASISLPVPAVISSIDIPARPASVSDSMTALKDVGKVVVSCSAVPTRRPMLSSVPCSTACANLLSFSISLANLTDLSVTKPITISFSVSAIAAPADTTAVATPTTSNSPLATPANAPAAGAASSANPRSSPARPVLALDLLSLP
jgi:hypothetical protein